MFNDELLTLYDELVSKKQDNQISKLFCLSCVNASLKWLEKNDITSNDEKLKMAQAVYDEYLDTNYQITKLSDTICKYWNEYINDDEFNLYDHIESEWF